MEAASLAERPVVPSIERLWPCVAFGGGGAGAATCSRARPRLRGYAVRLQILRRRGRVPQELRHATCGPIRLRVSGRSPCAGALRAIFRFVDKRAFERDLSSWLESVLRNSGPDARATVVHGKTVRGSATQRAFNARVLSVVTQ